MLTPEMNPNELRKAAAYYRERDNVGDERAADEFDAAAGAWEKVERQMQAMAHALHLKQARIEVLERALRNLMRDATPVLQRSYPKSDWSPAWLDAESVLADKAAVAQLESVVRDAQQEGDCPAGDPASREFQEGWKESDAPRT